MDKCKNKAEFLVPWAGKQVICCKSHAEALTNIGRVMGVNVQVAEVQMEDMCSLNDDLGEK